MRKPSTAIAVVVLFILCAAVLAGCGKLFQGSGSAAYPAVKEIEIKAVDLTKDFVNEDNGALALYKTTDGTVVYDLNLGKAALKTGQKARYDHNADAGLFYILKNGYPFKTFVNNRGIDAYITQMAIWWYTSEDELTSGFKNATEEQDPYGLSKITGDLVSKARQYADSGKASFGGKVACVFVNEDPDAAAVIGLFDCG